MNDRELLEKAATAAGLGLPQQEDADPIGRQYAYELGLWVRWKWGWDWFNPRHNSAHAFRLAVAIGLQITAYPFYAEPKHSVIARKPVWDSDAQEGNGIEVVEIYGDDPEAATRLAITQAAAEWAEHGARNSSPAATPTVEARPRKDDHERQDT